ncbi:unnamed protein product, partial [Staurois parvus]
MTRDCGHSTGDDQRLRTQYRRYLETADSIGDDQETADFLGREGEWVPEFDRRHRTFTKSSASGACTVGCHSRVPTLKMPVWEDCTVLDR